MRWFPAFNYIEARMAQAHLFDPLTENIAKFKQTPNEETLFKITQILDGLYVPHNLSLTKSNDNSLIIAYKRYRSYASAVVTFNYLGLGTSKDKYINNSEYSYFDFSNKPVKTEESENYQYDDYEDYDIEDPYDPYSATLWDLENNLTVEDELKLFNITNQELKDNLVFNNDPCGRLRQIFCSEAKELQYYYDYLLGERRNDIDWRTHTFDDDRVRERIFEYDHCDKDSTFSCRSNQSQTVEQWAQEQTTDKGQAAPVFKLNDETKLCYFQPMENSKDLLSWVKLCDLFVVHGCLVSFRRELYSKLTRFEVFKNERFGCTLRNFDVNYYNQLREDAIAAVNSFSELSAQVNSSQASDPSFLQKLSTASIMLYVRMSRYMDHFEYVLSDVLEYECDINDEYSWSITSNFFNFYSTYVAMLDNLSQLTTSCVKASLTHDTNEVCDSISNLAQSYEQEVAKLPIRLYEACAPYSSGFETAQDIQVKNIDFKSILQKVFGYRDTLLSSHLPIAAIVSFRDDCSLTNKISHASDYEGQDFSKILYRIEDNKDIEPLSYLDSFSLTVPTDDSVMLAHCLTLAVDNINQFFIRTLKHLGPTKNYLAFDNWYQEDRELAELIYPKYQELLTNYNFRDLIQAHKNCFSLLRIIIEHKGLDGVDADVLSKEPYYASLNDTISETIKAFTFEIRNNHFSEPLGAALVLLDDELVKLSNALINLQEDLPSEIQSILDSNTAVFSGVADYNFKKSLHLVNMARQFFNLMLLKQLNQVELANAARDVLLLNSYIALKRTALDCYCYANFETKESFIEHMAYISCVPAVANFTLPSMFGLEALKHLNALNGQANKSYELNECLGYPMVKEGLNEYLLSQSLAVINYGTMAVACELAIYLCNAKTQKELKSSFDTINIVINAIKYIKQTKNIDYLISNLSIILSEPLHFRDLAQEVLELTQVLAATITLLAPVSARCQSLSDAEVLQPLQKMLEDLLTDPLKVLSDMNLNQDLNKVDICGELSLFNKDSCYYQALSAEHFIESVRHYEYGPIGSLHCHIFGIEIAKLLSPTPNRVSPVLRDGRLTNCAKQSILNLLDKETSKLYGEKLLKGLCCNLTTVQATISSRAYATDSLISQVLSFLAESKTNTFKLKIDKADNKADETLVYFALAEDTVDTVKTETKPDTSSEQLTQAENAVVAAEADAKADAKPKAKAKSTRSKAKKADTSSEDLAQAESAAVAAEAAAKADAKPKAKAKSTRSKAKKADTSSEDLAQAESAAVADETAAKADTKPKAKSTRSKAKKADTSSEDLAQAENAVVAAETAAKDDAKPKTDSKPKAKAKSTRSKAKKADTSIADGGHEYVLVDATDYGEDEDFFSGDTTSDVPLYSNKRDVLQAIKNSLKAHREAFDNAQDQNEKSMISRRLQIINDFLNKGIMLARGFHVSKAKFELFAEKIESLFLNTLHQGMKYQDVRALTEIMLLFLQYIELSQGARNFNNGLSYLAKVKFEYIVSVIEP
ncbi:hypothetical protein MXE38_06450 [Anaerobiospirillum sp. NML120448]|uniref:hypothetical protein n=1 Tax=Anaerobiospirillum sp. NML120448 TaxID=2932816 RepID=UPI001FF17A4A|nr:hypothetical protein [Anaerobiospirillum sp. NML120448]MCK0514494.1 hypothetical protein [Anaerobiospirillum sp. NML120448]